MTPREPPQLRRALGVVTSLAWFALCGCQLVLDLPTDETPRFGSPVEWHRGEVSSIVAGDLNTDGTDELVASTVASFPPDRPYGITVLANSAGSVKSTQVFTSSTSCKAVVGELSGESDARKDIAVVCPSELSVLYNWGNGLLDPIRLPMGSKLSSVAVGQFIGDANQDLLVGDLDGYWTLQGPLVTTNLGFPKIFTTPVHEPTAAVEAVAVMDVVGSPVAERVVLASERVGLQRSTIWVKGMDSILMTLPFDYHVQQMALADVDGDGRIDVLASHGRMIEISASRAGTVEFEYGETITGFAAGDLDGDGDSDIVASVESGLLAMINTGTGSLGFVLVQPSVRPTANIVLGDFNGDDRIDIAYATAGATTGTNPGVFVLPGVP